MADVLPVDEDLAAVERHQAGGDLYHHRLALARAAHDHQRVAGGDAEIDAAQHRRAVEPLGDAAPFQLWRRLAHVWVNTVVSR
jgi:hypothetical protein